MRGLSDSEFRILSLQAADGPPEEFDDEVGYIVRMRLVRRGLLSHSICTIDGEDYDWFSITERGRIALRAELAARSLIGDAFRGL